MILTRRPMRVWRFVLWAFQTWGEAIVSDFTMKEKALPEIDFEKLPARDVTAEEFRAAAHAAGWRPDTLRCLLDIGRPPTGYTKVGKERLRLRN